MEVAWVKVCGIVCIEMMRFDWIGVNWVNWRKWARTTLWEWSYGQSKVSLSKWLEMSDLIISFQNEWNRWDLNELKWIEVNRGEMSDLMDLTWNNPMRKSLWSEESVPIKVTWVNLMGISLWVENECPYQFDLIDLNEKVPMFSWMNVPIKVT